MCSHDQRLLLKNNAILLREYMTARYMIAETGMEQLVWAFGPSDSIKLGKYFLSSKSQHTVRTSQIVSQNSM